ncbi:probable G-protein coupled receptor No18 [Lytechinus variegatus]|uniref:probable G-protein coupled receptor No18 n=1 Tax=Lytechinus variegatus TaxID=7654 RepID=UPI001BB0DA5E|nr:probable G-protein coupled receptor No18 [Lytechinus variegatus]
MASEVTFPGAEWTSYDPWFHITETPLPATNFIEFQTTANNISEVGTTDRSNETPANRNIVALVILPVVLICGLVGNTLVCIAVFRFAPLRIVANYFIVSLAIADLAVCGIVMPLAAIQELAGEWRLGIIICDVWVCLDVLMSTASIWNLCVIALDRYMAITRPVWYALRRTPLMATVAITVAWVLSIIVSIPALLFVGGYDPTTSNFCVLNISPVFAIISSMVSFYIPCVIVLIVYQRILVAARHHSRRRVRPAIMSVSTVPAATVKATTRAANNGSSTACSSSATSSNPTSSNPSATPCNNRNSHTNNNVSATNSEGQPSAASLNPSMNTKPNNQHLMEISLENTDISAADKLSDERTQSANGANNVTEDGQIDKKHLSVKPQTKRVTLIADDAPTTLAIANAVNHHRNHPAFVRRRQISVSRERRAAFVLAIVVGVFICCWLPFFIINVLLGICPNCPVSPIAFQVVTWLGWCNSILNPIIYTTFNRDFRNAFRKILFCGKL